MAHNKSFGCRIIAAILMVVLFNFLTLLSAVAENNEQPAEDLSEELSATGKLIGENGLLQLLFTEDGLLEILNTQTGTSWYSAPPDWNANEDTDAFIRCEIASQLIVQYMNEKKETLTGNSKYSSIDEGSYTIRKNKSGTGALIEYTFTGENENFMIPVKYILEDDGTFSAEILYDQIRENGEMKILQIQLLPYLASGCAKQPGSLLIPDGCGALMDFQTDKAWAQPYDEAVYGRDVTATYLKDYTEKENVQMPVYGMSSTEKGVFVILTQSEANARIKAVQAGYISDFAQVGNVFVYRPSDTTVLADKNWNSREAPVVFQKNISLNPRLSIYLLEGKTNSFSQMSAIYRNYLMQEKGMQRLTASENTPLYIETFGTVKTPASVLGFIINKNIKVTGFDDVNNMLRLLDQNQVQNIQMVLYGFNSGGIYDKYQKKFTVDSIVGGKDGWKNAKTYADSIDARLIFAQESLYVYREPFAGFTGWYAAKTMSREKAVLKQFQLSTGAKNDLFQWTLLKPKLILQYAEKFAKSLRKNDVDSVLISTLGKTLYGDYNTSESVLRHEMQEIVQQTLQCYQDLEQLLVDTGNIYSVYSADTVLDAPLQNSSFDLFSERIPFYQMVLHGLVQLSGIPVNCAADMERQMLLSIETGSPLHYRLTGEEPKLLAESKLNFIYNSYYENWTEIIAENYQAYNEVHKTLQNQFIVNYESYDGVTVTTYENGTKVIVNHLDIPQTYQNIALEPRSYCCSLF